ncbi:MAG: cytochrome c [Acidobacteria bacterium]|nr:cytochrome c [Acidobacteriota bacterium]
MRIAIKIASCAVIIVLVISVWFASPANVEATAASSAASRSLFVSNCARCHGADGGADTESGRLYDVPNIAGGRLRRKSSSRLTAIISKGGRSLPGFGKKLTKKQIASLVGYIRKL